MPRLSLAALVLAVITTLAACGGSKSNSARTSNANTSSNATTTSTTKSVPVPVGAPVVIGSGAPLTHAQWVTRGDAICAHLNARLSTSTVRSIRDFARLLPEEAAYERSALVELAKVIPPTSKRQDWQQFLNGTQVWTADLAKLGEMAQSTANGVALTTTPLAKSAHAVHERFAAIAKRNGFKQCSLV